MTELPTSLTRAADRFNRHFDTWLTTVPQVDSVLDSALRYALEGSGKRIRPLLVYGAARALNDRQDELWLGPAVAVELVHTYSLIHDDLPAMDNDDWRRGRATLHRVYDEATAILVGDALQAMAFEVLSDPANGLTASQRVLCTLDLARASGPSGMVGGQAIDMRGLPAQHGEDDLQNLHRRKTGALIECAVSLGARSANAQPDAPAFESLHHYASNLGLAFQVVDDVLDATGDLASLGKAGGSDARTNKITYLTLLGETGARLKAQELVEQSLAALQALPGDTDLLQELARFTLDRSH